MGIFTAAAGQALRMDNLLPTSGGAVVAELVVFDDGSVSYIVNDLGTEPATALYQIASIGPILTLPQGQPIYPVNGAGDYVLTGVTGDFSFTDYGSGVGVEIGTLTGNVWQAATLRETPVYDGDTIIGYQYQLFLEAGSAGAAFPVFMGDDTVTLGALDDVFHDYGGNLQAALGDGSDVAILYETSGSATVKFVDAGLGDDEIFYQGGNGTILGGEGNDSILSVGGSDGNWLFVGGGGNDQIEVTAGSARIEDGRGSKNDVYVGDPSNTAVILDYSSKTGGIIVDLVAGLAGGGRCGNDTLDGISHVNGTVLDDVMLGTVFETGPGSLGGTWFEGSGGNDSLTGASARDTLYGGNDMDTLVGRDGDDILRGDNGDDVLTGGAGRDDMAGGDGNDTFVFLATGDSTLLQPGRDRIRDFGAVGDTIDLSAIDGRESTPEDDALIFVGASEFTYRGQVRFEYVDGNTIVWVNNAGDTAADMRIDLSGIVDLTEGNFVL